MNLLALFATISSLLFSVAHGNVFPFGFWQPSKIAANTVLLLPFDTGSTIVDYSPNGFSPWTLTSVTVDTTHVKFGAGALDETTGGGTGNLQYVPGSSVFAFGSSADFTIECQLFSTSFNNGNSQGLVSVNNTGSGFFSRIDGAGTIRVGSQNGTAIASASAPFTNNTYNHWAWVRHSGTSTVYVAGTSVASGADTNNYGGSSSALVIGNNSNFSNQAFNGWADECRISSVARWTANFVPPTAAYQL